MKQIKSKVSPFQPLLKFPVLILIEIIKMMMPSEQYSLSKCSKRSRLAVKLSIPKKQKSEIWMHPIAPTVYFYLRIADTKFYLFKTYSFEYKVAHEYVCDLFRAPSDIYLEAPEKNAENFLKFIPAGSVKKSIFVNPKKWTDKLPDQSITQLSELHPNQEFVLVEGRYMDKMLLGHSFLDARNLMIPVMRIYCPFRILSSFQGEHLLLEDATISKSSIEVFVENWMKKKDDKLKTAILKLQRGCVIRDLKFEKYSGSGRQFQYTSIIKGHCKFPNGIFNISDGWDIRRKTDGKLANIKTTKDYFMFLVW